MTARTMAATAAALSPCFVALKGVIMIVTTICVEVFLCCVARSSALEVLRLAFGAEQFFPASQGAELRALRGLRAVEPSPSTSCIPAGPALSLMPAESAPTSS